MHPIEAVIVQAFIAPHRRPRWLSSLNSIKRRPKVLDRLNHCRDLDPRYVRPLQSNTDIVALLRSHGAPTNCYVLSAMDTIDGLVMRLEEAISEAERGGWGTIVSCIPGRLAYYYDECGERRCLLVRTAA